MRLQRPDRHLQTRRRFPRRGLALFSLLLVASACASKRPVTRFSERLADVGASASGDLEELTRQQRRNRKDVGLTLALARRHFEEGQLEAAARVLEASLDRSEDARVRARLASYLAENSSKEANARLAVEADGHNLEARRELAAALRAQGRLDEALECLKGGIGADIGNTELLLDHAVIYLELGDVAEAVRYLEYGIAVGTGASTQGSAENWYLLAELYREDWPFESAEYASLAGSTALHVEVAETWTSSLPLPLQRRPNLGFFIDLGTDEEMERLGNQASFILRESSAARAGLVAGDRILSVQGAPIADFLAARRLVERDWNDTDRVSFDLDRAGQRLSLSAPVSSEWERLRRGHQLIRSAQTAYSAKDYGQAITDAVNGGAVLGVYNPAAQILSTLAQVSSGRSADAVRAVEAWKVTERNPVFQTLRVRAHLARVQASGAKADLDLALSASEQALRVLPDSSFLMSCAGMIQLAKGDRRGRAEAERCFEHALATGQGGWALEQLAAALDQSHTRGRRESRATTNGFLGALAKGLAAGLVGAASGSSGTSWSNSQAGLQYTRTMYNAQ